VIVTSGTCFDTVAFTLNVSPPPVVVTGNATMCQGQTAQLTASGGGTYLWNTGATTSSINTSVAGNYSVIVTVSGCSDTAFSQVVINPVPVASAGNNVVITYGESATLNAGGGGTYLWSNGSTGSAIVVNPKITTQYCVVVTNAAGCKDTACVLVTVEPTDCSAASAEKIFIPSAFSPNGDGENETIHILFGYMDCIKTFHLQIFNRWGEMIFEAKDPDVVWNGTYNGKEEDSAVFAYYLNITLVNGDKLVKKGNISLFR
jgi:gliding motility-associated-like protein